MSGGEALTEEEKNFLLNLKWKPPITSNNPNPEYSSIQERLDKLKDSSITWVDRESIDDAIRSNSKFISATGIQSNINDIKQLKMIAGNDNKIKNDKFYFVSTRIMNALRPNGNGPSYHAYSSQTGP